MSQPGLFERLIQQRRALTVSELTAQIKNQVETRFADVWVEGEISNYHRHSSGHWYFTLKDQGAAIRCACFRMQNRYIRFTPEDGLTVRARGHLSLYETRGEYQIVVEYLDPSGIGALQVAFDQLKARLEKEGLFDAARKRALPLLPRCIGVVTSPTGAAIRDILRVIKRRNERVSVILAPVKVQGDGAGHEIAQAISVLNSLLEVDVIIVGRGGGSVEDLWSFNEEKVARAIHQSRVPIISAVGHETDFTIADFVADLRASTPSAAAEMVTARQEEICSRIHAINERMAKLMRFRLLELRNRISKLESSRGFAAAPFRIRNLSQRFDDAIRKLESAEKRSIKLRRIRLESLTARLRDADVRRANAIRQTKLTVINGRLDAAARTFGRTERKQLAVAVGKLQSMSPLAVLARGYAIAFDGNGKVIKQATQVKAGEQLVVRVAEGKLDCTVN